MKTTTHGDKIKPRTVLSVNRWKLEVGDVKYYNNAHTYDFNQKYEHFNNQSEKRVINYFRKCNLKKSGRSDDAKTGKEERLSAE